MYHHMKILFALLIQYYPLKICSFKFLLFIGYVRMQVNKKALVGASAFGPFQRRWSNYLNKLKNLSIHSSKSLGRAFLFVFINIFEQY